MRNSFLIFVLTFGVLLFGCKPEPSGTLEVEFYNSSSASISILKSGIGDTLETYFTLLSANDVFTISESQMGEGVSSLFGGIIPADSLIVVFNDSLKMVHIRFVEGSGGSSQFEGRNEIIWRNQPRSLMNLDSYTQEDRGDNRNEHIIARYYFTEEDLEYAIGIYE